MFSVLVAFSSVNGEKFEVKIKDGAQHHSFQSFNSGMALWP